MLGATCKCDSSVPKVYQMVGNGRATRDVVAADHLNVLNGFVRGNCNRRDIRVGCRVQQGTLRPPVALFALGGLVAINNLEFGLPAFGAALVVLAATAHDRSPRALARLGAAALAGVAIALAIVSALTLIVAGSLPQLGMLTTFPGIYGAEGFGLLPMPAIGFHLVVYVTFAAAIVVAVVRLAAAGDAGDATLTAALMWSGVFGLGAGSYFVGRSHPHVLIDLFSAWALALSLLTIAVAQAVVRRRLRRPQLAELLVLAGFGVMVC